LPKDKIIFECELEKSKYRILQWHRKINQCLKMELGILYWMPTE
jgi:hypothetical protein